MAQQPHVIFMNVAAPGHVNPTVPVLANLVAKGCKVTYFVEDTMRCVVEAAGAAWMPFRYASHEFTGIMTAPAHFASLSAEERAAVGLSDDAPDESSHFPHSAAYNTQLILRHLLQDLRALSPPPRVIVCDPLLPCGRVAAHALGVVPVSLLTTTGPGALPTDMVKVEGLPWVEGPRQWIKQEYGIDIFADSCPKEFYSPVLNLVATTNEFYAPPTRQDQIQRFGHSPFQCVGSLVGLKVKRARSAIPGAPLDLASEAMPLPPPGLSSAPLSLRSVRDAQRSGRRVVLLSLGSVVTGPKWLAKLGQSAKHNDGRPKGARSLTDYTGKDFCRFVYRACFDMAARDASTLVIVSLGAHAAEALEGLPEPPANVILRESVPQLDLLHYCDAFVTHGGSSSMHEALACGVPMCVIPISGDQPANADAVARAGAGLSFRDPLLTLCGESLGTALRAVLAGAGGPGGVAGPFRESAQRVAQQLAASDGVRRATDALLALATPVPLLSSQRARAQAEKKASRALAA